MKWILLSCAALIASCSLVEPENIFTKASELPLLKVEKGVSYMLGFELYPDAVQDSIAIAEQELNDAGMAVGRLQIDWPQMEPSQNEYDKAALEDELAGLAAKGQQPFLTLSVYDSDGPVYPEYLEGKDIDDAELQEQFNKLMDWVIPMLASYDGWGLVIANEPDNYYGEVDDIDEQVLAFTKRSIAHIHSINDEMAVSVTMNIENMSHSEKKMRELLGICDFLAINAYAAGPFPMEGDYSEADNDRKMQEMLDLADGKQVVVQEFGIPTNGDIINSNEAFQKLYYEQFFAFFEREPQMRVAYQFTLMDWSQDLVDIFNTAFEGEEVPQIFIDNYGSILKSLGLMEADTGRRKAGFSIFAKWVEKLNE